MTKRIIKTAKIPTIKLPDYVIKYARYKWEFLRRNQEYIDDWEKLEKELLEEEWAPLDEEPPEQEREFFEKWKIQAPLNPYISFDKMIDRFATKINKKKDEGFIFYDPIVMDTPFFYFDAIIGDVDPYRIICDWLYPEAFLDRPILPLEGWAWRPDIGGFRRYLEIAVDGKLTIKIDLNYSKKKLMQEFKTLIDEWKEYYEYGLKEHSWQKFCVELGKKGRYPPYDKSLMKEFEEIYNQKVKKKNLKRKQKYHFDNFDDYLKVYDLRKKKVSWANITSKLGLNSIQTARNHYKAACNIIEKGIKLYVK